MSAPVKANSIVRCPLCHDGKRPEHIGNSVMLCECCGAKFRVVYALPGKTGTRLSALVKEVKFGPNKEHR